MCQDISAVWYNCRPWEFHDLMKTCFVLSPIGATGSETRKRSDAILGSIIEPAVRTHGYEPIRADRLPEPSTITKQVIDHIVSDDLVIADLTDSNPNVFYELGICHAIRKPVMLLMLDGQVAPFDLHEMRRIPIHHYDQDIVVKARNEVERQILFIEQRTSERLSTLHSPVSIPRELFVYAIRSIDAIRPSVGRRWEHLAGRWVGYLEQPVVRKERRTERSTVVANVATVEDTVSGEGTITYVDDSFDQIPEKNSATVRLTPLCQHD
jgi:nucleoside 2-deoxyribosyltransferase